ncbi:hypothetical protein Tco_0484758, partial [Tanacetum coccineum]
SWRRHHDFHMTPSMLKSDDITNFCDGVKVSDIDEALRRLGGLTASGFTKNDGDVMFVELIKEYDDYSKEELDKDDDVVEEEELDVEYFDKFLTRSELAYHKYLLYDQIPPLFMRRPIIVRGSISTLKIPCNLGHIHVWKAYIDFNSPINIMTRMQYNWIMKRQLEPRDDPESLRGIIIDPSLSQVGLGKQFVELSNMTYDTSLGIVKFTNGDDEIAYIMPHKIEQFISLSNMEKEHKQSVYIRNEEDKRRGVGNVKGMMNSDKRVMAGKGEDIQYLSVLNVAGERPFHLYGTLASEVLVWSKQPELKRSLDSTRDVTTADRNDIIWLMASMGSSPCLNTGTVRPESSWGNSVIQRGVDD